VLVSRPRSLLRGLGPNGLAIHARRGHGYQLGFELACCGPAPVLGPSLSVELEG
jgi:hypothetical protein